MKVTSEADKYDILFCFVAGLCWAVEADELQVICISNTGLGESQSFQMQRFSLSATLASNSHNLGYATTARHCSSWLVYGYMSQVIILATGLY